MLFTVSKYLMFSFAITRTSTHASYAVRILKYSLEFPIKVRDIGNGSFEIDKSDPFDSVKKYWAYKIARPNEDIPVVVIDD